MVVIPILKLALGDLAGTLAVSTIEPTDRRFRPTDHSLAGTGRARDRNMLKIDWGLVQLKAAD
jgi:hypothetical protein